MLTPTFNPAGVCSIEPADGLPDVAAPEPRRRAKCWKANDGLLWIEELSIPPGKVGLIHALRMWIMAHGYLTAVLTAPDGRVVLLSRHPLLKYVPVDLPEVVKADWLHAPNGHGKGRGRCV